MNYKNEKIKKCANMFIGKCISEIKTNINTER